MIRSVGIGVVGTPEADSEKGVAHSSLHIVRRFWGYRICNSEEIDGRRGGMRSRDARVCVRACVREKSIGIPNLLKAWEHKE